MTTAICWASVNLTCAAAEAIFAYASAFDTGTVSFVRKAIFRTPLDMHGAISSAKSIFAITLAIEAIAKAVRKITIAVAFLLHAVVAVIASVATAHITAVHADANAVVVPYVNSLGKSIQIDT